MCYFPCVSLAVTPQFPEYHEAPIYTTYFADGNPNNIFHVKPTGNDTTGDGSFHSPWASLAGAENKAMPGDLILFHEGRYTTYTNGAGSWYSTNMLSTKGTAIDMIVIMGANSHPDYLSETTPVIDVKDYFGMTLFGYQVLDGINFQGGLSVYDTNVIIQNCDFIGGCAGQRDGNPAMIVFPAESPFAQNITIRNNSFHNNVGDHINGKGRSYAICMFESNTSDDGLTWNKNYTRIYYNKFYEFNGATSQRWIIYSKDSAHGVEIAYNRFFESNAIALGGFGQGESNTEGYDVHHNLVYNCDGLGYYWGEAIYGKWRSNIVIDNGYAKTAYPNTHAPGESMGLTAFYNSHGSSQAWGEVYNNVFYVDYPGEFYGSSANLTGYWTWVDFNAYADPKTQRKFENAKAATTNWQKHDVVVTNAIIVDNNYFATILNNSPLLNAGRYGENIGGFPAPSSILTFLPLLLND